MRGQTLRLGLFFLVAPSKEKADSEAGRLDPMFTLKLSACFSSTIPTTSSPCTATYYQKEEEHAVLEETRGEESRGRGTNPALEGVNPVDSGVGVGVGL